MLVSLARRIAGEVRAGSEAGQIIGVVGKRAQEIWRPRLSDKLVVGSVLAMRVADPGRVEDVGKIGADVDRAPYLFIEAGVKILEQPALRPPSELSRPSQRCRET